MSLLRSLERRERIEKGITEHPHPKVLDDYNNRTFDKDQSFLHPRKGFRHISLKRSRATMITAEQKSGKFPPTIVALEAVRSFILTGRYK